MAELIIRTGIKEGATLLIDFDDANQKVVMKMEEAV
jgi:ATP-dependent Clp protease ATP-binding subunit ClpC